MNIIITRKSTIIGIVLLLMMAIGLLLAPGIAAENGGDPPYIGMGMNPTGPDETDPIDPTDPEFFSCLIWDASDSPNWYALDPVEGDIKVTFDKDGTVRKLECKEKDYFDGTGEKKIYTSNDNPFIEKLSMEPPIFCNARGIEPKTGDLGGLNTTNWTQTVSKNGKVKLTCE